MIQADPDQGTWQFMSAGLISGSPTHDFKDDLESSVYVLLWTTLMYSVVPNKSLVQSTLSNVLDPEPYESKGGVTKIDYLKGGTFMDRVEFPDRPALHQLLSRLGKLFAVRYENKPTEPEREAAQQVFNAGLIDAYNLSYACQYDLRWEQLNSHDATIQLFETALQDRSAWPDGDVAEEQNFGSKKSTRPVTKSCWRRIDSNV